MGFDPISAALAFMAARAIPGVEEVYGGRYRRTTAGGGIVEPDLDGPLFDGGADHDAIDAVLMRDPLLAPLVARRPGLRVPGAWDGLELAVRAVLGQQVSVAAASTLAGRVVVAAGTALATPVGTLTHVFPTAEALAAADLSRLGMPSSRAQTVSRLARAVADGEVALDGSRRRAETEAALLALPGIGPWTVAYVAMRALGDRDALPATDLGLRHAFAAAGLPSDERSTRRRAERWRPWRSYAVMQLWAELAARG